MAQKSTDTWPTGLRASSVGRYGTAVALYPESGESTHARHLGVESDIPLDELLDTVRVAGGVAKSVLVRTPNGFIEVTHVGL